MLSRMFGAFVGLAVAGVFEARDHKNREGLSMIWKLSGAVVGLVFAGMVTAAQGATLTYSGGYRSAVPTGCLCVTANYFDSEGLRYTVEDAPGGLDGFIEMGDPRDLGGLLNGNGGRFTMAAVDGATFDLTAFDFVQTSAENNADRSASDISVIGYLASGGAVSFNTGSLTASFQTTVLPTNFIGLTSVLFDPIVNANGGPRNYAFIIDNVVINETAVIPIPAALPLFATALAVIGLIGWRRRDRA